MSGECGGRFIRSIGLIQMLLSASLYLLGFGLIFALSSEVPERHPCYRECVTGKKMTCGYNFTVEHFWVLSKACFNCPNVSSDCSRLDCIPADGNRRGIAVVNRLLPGPSIRVCEGDTIVADIHNHLYGEGTAIHWHGIHQKGTPWMDGVPGITQCPIPSGNTFRYEFDVPLGGSYFWHSHAGFQRGDGVFGSLVVRKPKVDEKHLHLYDFDLPEHEILIWDWLGELSLPVFLNHHHDDGDNKPRGILINGKGFPPGFFKHFTPNETLENKENPFVSPYEVRVKQGNSYRLRLISNGVLNCPLEVSIEKHTFIVINSDGFDLEPKTVSSIVIYAGERWDIVLRADQPPGSYWIKFRGLMDCDDRFTSAFQMAVLNYESIPRGSFPPHLIKTWAEAAANTPGIQLNPLNVAPGISGSSLSIAELSSLTDDDPSILTEKADQQFYLSYDFNPIDNIRFHGPHIPLRTVRKGQKLYTPQFNYISHVMPNSPILTQPETLNRLKTCNGTDGTKSNQSLDCTKEYCECTHMLTVELNSIVEIVLVDRGYTFNANHPFHLHGHAFRVVAMEKLSNVTEPSIVKERDERGMIARRRSRAPIKDSVTVPDGGFTIIRFRADNPGFWFFHCHITFHVEVGMGLIIQVGNSSQIPSSPENFPKCGDYLDRVGTETIRMVEMEKPIVPLKPNSSNPMHPPYDTISSSAKPPKKSPQKNKQSSGQIIAPVILLTILVQFINLFI